MRTIPMTDDAFTVIQKRPGLYQSIDRDGTVLITSLNEHECVIKTCEYLAWRQSGLSPALRFS
jgi:hypothetical protein